MVFNNKLNCASIIGQVDYKKDLRLLPQLYRASAQFASQQSNFYGVILDLLDLSGYKYVSMDVRTAMLMAGWYPSIPGWHCDDFWRPFGQPELESLPSMRHFGIVLGADVSATEYITEPLSLPAPTELYEVLDSEVPLYGYYNSLIEEIGPKTQKVKEGEIWEFGGLDFHRTCPAEKNGWRTFIRITVSNHREPKDEVRTQTQVYLTDPFKGW